MKSVKFAFFILLFSQMTFGAVIFKWGLRDDLVYFKKNAANFKQEIESLTKGEIQIELASYKESEEKKGLATDWITSGRYGIIQELTGKLDQKNSELKVWSLPFLFRNDAHVEKYLASLGQDVLKHLETDDLQPVDYSFSGGFLMFHGAQINKMDDLVGQIVTIEDGYKTYEHSLKKKHIALNLNRHKSTHYAEQIIAVADEIAMNNTIQNTVINLTDHRVVSRVVFVSKALLNKLSKENQRLFLATLKKYLKSEREDSIEGKKLILALLKNRGAKFNPWTPEMKKSGQQFFNSDYENFEKHNPGITAKIEGLWTEYLVSEK